MDIVQLCEIGRCTSINCALLMICGRAFSIRIAFGLLLRSSRRSSSWGV